MRVTHTYKLEYEATSVAVCSGMSKVAVGSDEVNNFHVMSVIITM